MAYTAIDNPGLFFNTKIYTGNGSAGHSITGVGFQPDWVWIKTRSDVNNHTIFDVVRGVTKRIRSNQANAENTSSGVTSFDSDGFTVGSDSAGNSGTMVAWNWKAGTTSGIATNASTNITPSGYSFNQTSGFSIIAYTGTAVDGAYLPHGLGKAPELLFLKSRSLAESWQVYSAPTGNQGRGHLDAADAFDTGRGEWYSNNPDSVNMRISNDSHVNSSGATYIAYFFTSIQGFSKINSYTGNANANGPYIHTGFKPALVLVKNTTESDNWVIVDNRRDVAPNPHKLGLFPDTSGAEAGDYLIDTLSNGFKIRTTSGALNNNNVVYLYLAFAEAPIVSSLGVPSKAGTKAT